jgi:hypothetical protein
MTQITHTLLGPDASFEGKLEFEGDVRIDGRFRGEIVSNDRLIIGEGAVVYGNLQVGTLVLNGNLEGQVHVRESSKQVDSLANCTLDRFKWPKGLSSMASSICSTHNPASK